MTADKCPHEYAFEQSDTVLAVCRLCGFRYVKTGQDIPPAVMYQVAELLEFVAIVDEDPTIAQESRRLAQAIRKQARHDARWGWLHRLTAPLAHPAALVVMLVGFWTWWLLDPVHSSLGSGLVTWGFRAVWTVWVITMIVLRTQQVRRRGRKTNRRS